MKLNLYTTWLSLIASSVTAINLGIEDGLLGAAVLDSEFDLSELA